MDDSRPDAAAKAATDPCLRPETIDMTRRMTWLRPRYGAKISVQALWLDLAADQGVLQLRHPTGSVGTLPVAEFAACWAARRRCWICAPPSTTSTPAAWS
ncbi:hypothetical protein GCM10009760_63550 [Kitasatospora kazusensis]|uniref:Uncharacterized protein n=1 Tax=Kitasatospora kazusensis TaxID=407974 RepID=A0ABP4KC85_9ACTN